MNPTATETRALVFSVIVPTHGRSAQLTRCLGALSTLDYPRDGYEVIVVDDGGSAETAAIVANVTNVSERSFHYLSTPRGGPAAARNFGVTRASGRYVAFTDDDCMPATDWLTRLDHQLAMNPSCLVGGLTVNALPAVPYSTASQLLIDYLYDYYHRGMRGARFLTTNNLALATKDFRVLGGFDGTFPLAGGEDREFSERWQQSGRELVYAEDVLVHHSHHLNLLGFVRQHLNYGRGADYLHRSRARHERTERRPRFEPATFYVNLVRFPFTRVMGWRAVPLAGLMCLSQAAYVAGYVFQRLTSVFGPVDSSDSF